MNWMMFCWFYSAAAMAMVLYHVAPEAKKLAVAFTGGLGFLAWTWLIMAAIR